MDFTFGEGVDYRRGRRDSSGRRQSSSSVHKHKGSKAKTTATNRVAKQPRKAPPSPITSHPPLNEVKPTHRGHNTTHFDARKQGSHRRSRSAYAQARAAAHKTGGRVSILDAVFGPGTAEAEGFRARRRKPKSTRPPPRAKRRSVSPIRALRKPANNLKKDPSRVFRPTLSAQLAAIAKSAEEVTTSLNKSRAPGVSRGQHPVLTTPSDSFTVGRLQCKYPSPVKFYQDHCTYVFHHPFQKSQITMEMFYRDMTNVRIKGTTLMYQIPHMLGHFGKDYDPRNRRHGISIQFSSPTDAAAFCAKIHPMILSQCL